jgi:ATP-dependent helicase HrpA
MTDPRLDELRALLPRGMVRDWVAIGARAARLVREGAQAPSAALDRLLADARASVAMRERRAAAVPDVSFPPGLPISARAAEIVATIRENQVVVIAGETGSGKTTQIPKMCLAAGLGVEAMIGCTQPRRVAAQSISRRIAEELGVSWGREVGCKIRFDDRSGSDTYIKLMTDGILLAETQGDRDLAEYNALIIDEAHERSLNIDFLLGYLPGLLARRRDLKLIITSATIDTAAFSRAFGNAPVIEVSGRTFPVEVIHAPPAGEPESPDDWPDEPGTTPVPVPAGPGDSEPSPISREGLELGASLRRRFHELADTPTPAESCALAADVVMHESGAGDVLIFLPGERDIREAADLLEGRFGREVEIVPLYGRLSSGDQQRVFAPGSRRRVVIATNIAETSLTIPGIRYVIDSGLARLSRYNPRTRTRRLPIEAVSQSSANQRKGRAGRIADGLCIRLYSEDDFRARPAFTQPEIQRANLAEVILRMIAFQLGQIETFPFLNPPTPAAISGGYSLLHELGALDEQRQLTPLGRELARLPIDPTLGRMLLQARHEGVVAEVLVLASGLSIQDPRERPLDRREAAEAAHRRHADPRSDFLSLLNLWNTIRSQWQVLRTQNHFLSYLRVCEWRDLHAQLAEALDHPEEDPSEAAPADDATPTPSAREQAERYTAIHRAVLAGLVGHVATRQERNVYRAPGGRLVQVFPGSNLHERGERPGRGAKQPPEPKQKSQQPAWIVAGEIVETSQLFARTLAGIDPHWIVDLAPHCTRTTHMHPHWSIEGGRVLAEEVITLQGLEIFRRKVAYGTLNPDEATRIFIRSALVEDQLLPPDQDEDDTDPNALRQAAPHRGPSHPFLEHNRAIRQKIENWQTRLRRYDLGDVDDALQRFYSRHIQAVSSVHDLNRLLREHPEPGFLCVTEAELTGGRSLDFDTVAFPDAVSVGGQPVDLAYAYAPGEDHDGVTVKLPVTLANTASAAVLEWAVPGLRESKIEELLRALPKSLRRELMPFPPKITEIVREFVPEGSSFLADLGRFLTRRYGVTITAESWPADALPAHLQPRIELVGHDRKVVAAGRDLPGLREQLRALPEKPAGDSPEWKQACQKWERFGVTGWNFGDLPGHISIGASGRLFGWPGLELDSGHVHVRLFRSQDAARQAGLAGFQRLTELALSREFAWLEKDLRSLARLDNAYAPLGTADELRTSALIHLRRHILPNTLPAALTQQTFAGAVEAARSKFAGLVPQLIDRLSPVLALRQQIVQRAGPAKAPEQKLKSLNDLSQLDTLLGSGRLAKPAPGAAAAPPTHWLLQQLNAVLPPRFLEVTTFERLPQLPRYLKALLLRAERAANNPPKDAERARQLAPFIDALRQLPEPAPHSPDAAAHDEFRWLIEEFKVSLFAQELGTAVPVSPKRLTEVLENLRAR